MPPPASSASAPWFPHLENSVIAALPTSQGCVRIGIHKWTRALLEGCVPRTGTGAVRALLCLDVGVEGVAQSVDSRLTQIRVLRLGAASFPSSGVTPGMRIRVPPWQVL